mgnify:CR=1 FL=1
MDTLICSVICDGSKVRGFSGYNRSMAEKKAEIFITGKRGIDDSTARESDELLRVAAEEAHGSAEEVCGSVEEAHGSAEEACGSVEEACGSVEEACGSAEDLCETAEERMIECPVCGSPIEDEPRYCPRCDTPHHQDCWDYVGGCAIFACRDHGKSRALLSPSAELQRPVAPRDGNLPKVVSRWFNLYRYEGGLKALSGLNLLALLSSLALAAFCNIFSASFSSFFLYVALFAFLAVYPLLPLLLLSSAAIGLQERQMDGYITRESVASAKAPSRELIDRLDPPPLEKKILLSVSLLKTVVRYMLVLEFILGTLAFIGMIPFAGELFASFVALVLLLTVVIPTVESEFEKRFVALSALQNRLVRTFKQKT